MDDSDLRCSHLHSFSGEQLVSEVVAGQMFDFCSRCIDVEKHVDKAMGEVSSRKLVATRAR